MIICCGEALIDMLPRTLETGEDVYLPIAGGAIFNTAITLGRLGVPTGFVSGISTDMFGDQLINSLNKSNVSTAYCVRKPNPTTLAFVKLSDGQAKYNFMDENSAGRTFDVSDLPDIPENVEALHFGAISLIPESCGSAYEALMARFREKTVISIDPNIRPNFITDPQAHRERIKRMTAMSDIVKVSNEDLEWIAPNQDSDSAINEMIANQGVSIVILTKGSLGVELYTSKGKLVAAAKKTDVVDTIGAGDSFNGGLVAGLRKEALLQKDLLRNIDPLALKPALELGVEIAAFTVSRAGANPPWAYEIE